MSGLASTRRRGGGGLASQLQNRLRSRNPWGGGGDAKPGNLSYGLPGLSIHGARYVPTRRYHRLAHQGAGALGHDGCTIARQPMLSCARSASTPSTWRTRRGPFLSRLGTRRSPLFAERYGRETIRETWTGVIDPENLGVWTRVLRGTARTRGRARAARRVRRRRAQNVALGSRSPYGRASGTAGCPLARSDRSRETDSAAGARRRARRRSGPVRLRARAPCRFCRAGEGRPVAARTGALAEEYMLRWSVPDARARLVIAVGLGPLVIAHHPVRGPGTVGAAVCSALARPGAPRRRLAGGRQRRAESHAQMNRIRALERSVALKEQRERAAVGFFEGSVIAGKYRLGPQARRRRERRHSPSDPPRRQRAGRHQALARGCGARHGRVRSPAARSRGARASRGIRTSSRCSSTTTCPTARPTWSWSSSTENRWRRG